MSLLLIWVGFIKDSLISQIPHPLIPPSYCTSALLHSLSDNILQSFCPSYLYYKLHFLSLWFSSSGKAMSSQARLLRWHAQRSNRLCSLAGRHRPQSWLLVEAISPDYHHIMHLWVIFSTKLCAASCHGNQKVICWSLYSENKVWAKLRNTRGRGGRGHQEEQPGSLWGEVPCIIPGEKLRWCWREGTRPPSTGLGPAKAGIHFLVWGKETLRVCALLSSQ